MIMEFDELPNKSIFNITKDKKIKQKDVTSNYIQMKLKQNKTGNGRSFIYYFIGSLFSFVVVSVGSAIDLKMNKQI